MNYKHETPFDICPATKEEAEFVDNKLLGEFNTSQVPVTQEPTLVLKNYVIKDDNGTIIGGIKLEDCPKGHKRYYLKKSL